ncbi:hypothetical protein [Streptomyces justiciae]|uniref:hypothetical protein n=1 Tax=Streptomyces justiciae TaxID=2780140 RepID=UPI0021197F80|nr:hypothetical protein [Streptomyces justiciae]MCW8378685.1 hypothetical protein [Streptomyces justiciae]
MSESRRIELVDVGGTREVHAGAFASFVRFVVCGGGVGLLASAVVPTVAEVMPYALANALITVVSTLLCTELHALITFRTGRWAGLRRHVQSAGSAAASYAVTTVAVLLLHTLQPTAGRLLEQAVYLGAASLAGIGRFLVLRLVVFADGLNGPSPKTEESITTAVDVKERRTPAAHRNSVTPSASRRLLPVQGRLARERYAGA